MRNIGVAVGTFIALMIGLLIGIAHGGWWGAYQECRRSWATIEDAPRVIDACNERFGVQSSQPLPPPASR